MIVGTEICGFGEFEGLKPAPVVTPGFEAYTLKNTDNVAGRFHLADLPHFTTLQGIVSQNGDMAMN